MTNRPTTPDPRRPLPLELPPGVVSPTRGDPIAFCQAVAEAFSQAAAAADQLHERYFKVAHFTVRLRFAGGALVPLLTPALAHLAAPATTTPDLTINLWETDSTGVEPPPPAWPYEDFQANGAIQAFGTEDVLATFQMGTNTLNVLDAPRGQAYYWVRSGARLPTYELGAPLRWNLHLWLRRQGYLSVHAGAIGTPAGGVLLVGRGGSGKSNTSLSALQSNLLYAADDYSLVGVRSGPEIFSLYSTGKAHPADLARLPFLQDCISNPDRLDTEKALFFLNDHFPDKLATGFPARAVVAPRITGQPRSRLHLTTAAAGMAALAPSTIAQLPGMQAGDFQVLVRFFRAVPSYILELGTDRAEVMATITQLVTALNAGQRPAQIPA